MGLLDPPALTKAVADTAYAQASAAAPITSTNPPTVLPRVVINTTTGAMPADTVTYLDGTVTINGSQPYSGATQVRGRGNTTWQAAKKPWRLKLTTAASLLGMPAERDWVLLANAFDESGIHNAVAMEIGSRCAGLAWTPRFRFVELEMNGVYLGLYQLGEHVEISRPNKMNVTAASGTTGLALTGAYSLEMDNYAPTFTTTQAALPIAMDDPDGTTPAHKTYIQDWINAFETALYSASWLDPTTGYARFIDQASFIDWYLVEELCRNGDSNGFSSIKMVKTRDTDAVPGKLFLGPLWDFDRSLVGAATGFYTIVPLAGGDQAKYPGMKWIARMLNDPAFFSALVARWQTLRTALTTGDTVFAVVDRLTDRLAFATTRDERKWSYNADQPALGAAINTFLATRMAWLSTQWIIDTTPPSVPTSLAASPGNGQVGLTWTASTDNVAVVKYRVRRGGTVVAEPTGTSYVNTGLTNGTAYSFTVSAVDAAGNESAQTAGVSSTPSATDTTAPSAPSNLAATPGNAQVVLSWTASTDNVAVTGYRVRRGGTLVGPPTSTSYTDTGLTNGTAYSYTVTAVDGAGNESAASATATATPSASTGTTETWTGTDGASWPVGWNSFGGSPRTIQGNKGRMTMSGAYGVARLTSMPAVTGFDETVTVKAAPTGGGGAVFIGVAGALQDWPRPKDGHALRIGIDSSGNAADLAIRSFNNNDTGITLGTSSTPVTASTAGLKARLQRNGTLVRAKVWPAADAEPGTWTLSFTDSSPTASTSDRAFLSAESGGGYVDFDDLAISAV